MLTNEYDFYVNADVSEYAGQWIAIWEKKIIAHGKNAKKVYEEAKKKTSGKQVLLSKIPGEETLIF